MQFEGCFFGISLDEMCGFSCDVLGSPGFLAPVALLSPLEIIVLAFRALPASLRELKCPF